ncbi:hypothetical protein RCS94_11290 [Orbaceae bacterium ac157xtp]
MLTQNSCINKNTNKQLHTTNSKRIALKSKSEWQIPKPAPRRGLRVVALDNPYRSGDADHEKNTIIKQTETTTLPSILCAKNNPNRQLRITNPKGIFLKKMLNYPKQ